MKKYIMFLLSFVLVISFSACKKTDNNTEPASESSVEDYYIIVNGETLSKNYIGYFFYIAQETMLSEAGWNKENSTPQDVKTYWETTEIDGVNAVDAARDAAVKNAVEQKVKYFKAVSEGIVLSDVDLKSIDEYISSTIAENGGEQQFAEKLKKTGTDIDSYRQITIENELINRLFQKYTTEGVLTITDEEFSDFYNDNIDKLSPEEMADAAIKSKFNAMVKEWEKEFTISINDKGMDEFVILYN